MKKIIYSAMAVAMLATTSCKDDFAETFVGDQATVEFSISTPEIGTRAYSDGQTATVLQYAVYDETGAELTALTKTYGEIKGSTTVSLELTTGETYSVIFWAAAPEAPYTVDFGTKTMTVNYTNAKSNDEKRDAFYKYHTFTVSGAQTETIELRRPFAQLNIGTEDYQKATNAGYTPNYSYVKVPVSSTLNLKDGSVGEASPITFGVAPIKKDETFPVAGNQYISMNYLLVPADKGLVDVEFGYSETETGKAKTRTISNVPVQRNYRTNIYGKLLTSEVDVNVEIEPDFDEPAHGVDALFQAAAFGGEVTLTEDVVLDAPLNVQANMTLNLNGKTLTGAVNVADNVQVTVNNGNIVNEDKTVSGITSNGDLTLNDVKITSARHAIRIESGKAVINGGKYMVAPISKSTLHALNVGDNGTRAEVIIKGGQFIGPKGTSADSGSAVNVRSGSTVAIEGGDFSGGKTKTLSNGGTLTVVGGSFDQDPAAFVADGYKVVVKDGKYVVVANSVDNVVASKDDVQNALKDAVANGDTNIELDANGAEINLNYGLTKANVPAGTTVTLRNAIVEGRSYGNGVDGTIIFENCTFKNTGAYSIHFDNGNGDVVFKNCELYGWNSFGSTLKSVKFDGSKLFGNGTYALIRSYVNLTLENCIIDTTEANHEDNYSEGVEAVNGATLTEKNVTYVVSNAAALQKAIQAGKSTIALTAGTYVIPTEAQGKTLTFVGTGNPEDVRIATKQSGSYEGCNYALDGSTVVFENITITTDGKTYTGYARCKGTYKNCVINNTYTLYDNSVFENCTFNVNGDAYNIWTWGAPKATFNNCTFNCDGKSMLLYGQANTKLTMNNCVFNDKGGLNELKAAIEIGNDYNKSYELIVNNATVNGFAINDKGINTNTTLWANKNSMPQDKLNVVVDGVDVY